MYTHTWELLCCGFFVLREPGCPSGLPANGGMEWTVSKSVVCCFAMAQDQSLWMYVYVCVCVLCVCVELNQK